MVISMRRLLKGIEQIVSVLTGNNTRSNGFTPEVKQILGQTSKELLTWKDSLTLE